jgi:peptide-methionine (R)-S-oxide reductase
MEKKLPSQEELKARLTEEQYKVTQCSATERAFTGKYYNFKGTGVYHCICCDAPLFTSNSKYDSGTGWPSFYEAVSQDAIKEITDSSYGMVRTEILCGNCDAHLGHVFPDGPKPTGLRYCTNSASLNFVGKEE